jgi:nucleoside-diphosphate-sugar epimerase
MERLILGCGYLGRRVAARWRQQGDRVFATTRRPAQAEEFRARGWEPIVCDVLDPASLRGLPAAATVLHCVGLDRSSGQSMREVYVTGLANVLAALPPPDRFLYVSSTSVYGQVQGEEVDEAAATEPEEEAGQIVLQAERLLRERLPGAVVLRFAGIYGPGRLLRQKAIAAGEPLPADPERWLNLIQVDDGAAAVLAAAERGQAGAVYNVCDDRPVRRREFYALLARLLGAPPPRFAAPPPGAPLPPHERANRRISNRRMHEALQVRLRYPTFEEGLRAALSTASDNF